MCQTVLRIKLLPTGLKSYIFTALRRRKTAQSAASPHKKLIDATSPAKRKAWAWLIQKIYEIDPLNCPQCKGAMKIISVIAPPEVVKHILQHMGLWEMQKRPQPKINSPPVGAYCYTPLQSIPSYDSADPDYPFEANM